MRLENTPDGRVVSWLFSRDEEQMKMKMREGRREMEWNERENRLPKFSKTPEGREERLLESRKKSDVKVCEDGMKKK